MSAGVAIFDFDGTLYRLPVDWVALRVFLGLAPTDSLTTHLQSELDSGDPHRARWVLGTLTEHERAAVPHGEFLPGALDVLTELAGTQPVAVLTRNSRYCVLDALAPAGLGDVYVVGREDARRLKPDPEGVRTVLAHFGGSAERSVLVGDTFHDVGAAGAAGVCSVVVPNAALTHEPDGAAHYVPSLRAALDVIRDRTGAPLP